MLVTVTLEQDQRHGFYWVLGRGVDSRGEGELPCSWDLGKVSEEKVGGVACELRLLKKK